MSSVFSSTEPSGSSSAGAHQEMPMSRLYVFFGQVSVVEGVTWLKAVFYTQDGSVEPETVCGYPLKPVLDESPNVNLYYLDYPSYYTGLSFEVGPEGSDGSWLKTGLIKIKDGAYRLDFDIRYTYLNETSGWQSVSLSQQQFASYILAGIDHTISDSSRGFMAYPSIKNTFYDHITDYSEDVAKQTMWTDIYTNETISFYDKWKRIESNYEENRPSKSNPFWIKALGVAVCLCSVATFCFIVRKSRHGKTKTEN